MFAFKIQLTRSVILIFAGLSIALAWAKEEGSLRWQRRRLTRADLQKRIILLGSPEETQNMLGRIDDTNDTSYRVVLQFNIDRDPIDDSPAADARALRQRRPHQRRPHQVRQDRAGHQRLRTRGRRGVACRRFFQHADCPHRRRRFSWRPAAGVSLRTGRLAAGSSQAGHRLRRSAGHARAALAGAAAVRPGREDYLPRPDPVPAETQRHQRPPVHHVQVPLDGHQRRAAQARAWPP